MGNPKYIILLGAAIIIVGSFLPWATLRSVIVGIDKAGTDGDGVITLGMGILAGIAALVRKPAPGARTSWIAIVMGVLVGLIAIIDMADINDSIDSPYADINIGIGLYLVLIGAVITVVGGYLKAPGIAEVPIQPASSEFDF